MRLPTIILGALSATVIAQPFIIVSTRVQHVVPTHIRERRQGLLDALESAVDDVFGSSDSEEEDSTTLVAPATRVSLPPPVSAEITSSADESEPTVSPPKSDDDDDDEDEDSETEERTSTTSARSTARSSSTSAHATADSTTLRPESSPAISSPTPTSTASASTSDKEDEAEDDSGGVPAGGVAVAVIMVLLILSITAILVFKYHPRCQAWWAARQEKARDERSYRDGIDGPGGLSSSPTLRQQALAGGASRRRTMLQSFFAPATARLSATTEIRRKPVNWGEPSSSAASLKVPDTPVSEKSHDFDSEKIPMSAAAAPLGQIERWSIMPPPAKPQVAARIPPPVTKSPRIPATTPEINAPLPASPGAQSLTALPTARSPRQPIIQELPTPPPTFPMPPRSRPAPSPSPSPVPTRAPSLAPRAPQIPVNSPVSPMSLFPQRDPVTPGGTRRSSVDRLPPISPLSTHQQSRESMATIARAMSAAQSTHRRVEPPLPALPPVPGMPGLVHAKRGSDGVFRLN